MGNCQLCGKSAGLFRKVHDECVEKQREAESSIWTLALRAARQPTDLPPVHTEIARISLGSWVTEARQKQLLIAAWEQAAESALDDSLLSEDEEQRLSAYAEQFGLTQDDLNAHSWLQRVAVAAALRDLDNGIFPERVQITGPIPFNLQSGERLAWLFMAGAYEERTKTQYVGGSSGVSVRIVSGLYYRTSAFKGHPVVTSYMHHLGDGFLGLSDKHVYFHSQAKSLRIPYRKIVSFVPYDDGIGIHRDAASAKPIVFLTGDGWSVFNLASKLSAIS